MAIPSVSQGWVFDPRFDCVSLDSPEGREWLASISSFRFEPDEESLKPFTVRKEKTKTGDYWYGYRKVAGKLHKKYIGKDSEVNTDKLEEIAETLNISPELRVTDKVTEITERSERLVAEKVTDAVTIEEFTALKSQVQALQESLEVLRSELPGKFDAGNFEELPTVTDNELQIKLGNLKAENERLQSEYNKLLSSSHLVTEKLREEVREVRSQLEQERADREEVEAELRKAKDEAENSLYLRAQYHADLIALQHEHKKLQGQLSDLKQNSESEFDSAGKAGELVSWLRKEVGKALPKQVTVKAVQKILEGEQ